MKKTLFLAAALLLIGAGCSTTANVDTMTTPSKPADQTTTQSPPTEDTTTEGIVDTTFTLADVAKHGSKDDCYTTVRGSVYDVTSWISKHPGGEKAILSICGKDGTAMFEGKHDGQPRPENELSSFQIGTLVQ